MSNGKYADSAENLGIQFTCPDDIVCGVSKDLNFGAVADKVDFKRKGKNYGIIYSYDHRTNVLPGQLYCYALKSDKGVVSICQTYGTGQTEGEYLRVPIQ